MWALQVIVIVEPMTPDALSILLDKSISNDLFLIYQGEQGRALCTAINCHIELELGSDADSLSPKVHTNRLRSKKLKPIRQSPFLNSIKAKL